MAQPRDTDGFVRVGVRKGFTSSSRWCAPSRRCSRCPARVAGAARYRPADRSDERGIGARRRPFAPLSGRIAAQNGKTRPTRPREPIKSTKPENPSRQIIQVQKRAAQKKQQAFLHGLDPFRTLNAASGSLDPRLIVVDRIGVLGARQRQSHRNAGRAWFTGR